MRIVSKEATLAQLAAAVLMAVAAATATTTVTATALGENSISNFRCAQACGFVSPAIAVGSITTRSDAASAAEKSDGQLIGAPGTHPEQVALEDLRLARRMQLRRVRQRPRIRTRSSTATDYLQRPRYGTPSEASPGEDEEAGNLFR